MVVTVTETQDRSSRQAEIEKMEAEIKRLAKRRNGEDSDEEAKPGSTTSSEEDSDEEEEGEAPARAVQFLASRFGALALVDGDDDDMSGTEDSDNED